MGRRLLVLSLILFVKTAVVVSQQEACSINGVSPTAKQVSFEEQTQFQCRLGGSERRWWQSRECSPESFARSDRANCRDGDLMCVVPVEVYQDGYFYFCCTTGDALSVADASQLECFQVQICTQVNREEFPANVIPGTVGTIRIDVTGHPQPSASLAQPTDARNVVRNDSISPTNFSFVASFVVPLSPQQQELNLQVDFTTPQGCLLDVVPATGHARVIQNADTLLEELGVTPAGGPTPSPSSSPAPRDCDCFFQPWIAAAVGVGLILVTVIVTLCVTYCICKGKRNPFCGFYDTSGSLPASTSGETSSGSYATGSYATGPYEVTQVAPSAHYEEPPPVYSTIPAVGAQNGQPRGEAVTTSRPSLLRFLSSERTPEETPPTSETLLYNPQPPAQSQPQYAFRNGLPADGSSIPDLQGLSPGTVV